MSQLEEQLQELKIAACQHPPGSPQRQKDLTRLIRLLTPRLWRENTPYYGDALQQTWIYFCKNLCDRYDETRSSITTWLNYYLRRRLQDHYIETQKQQATQANLPQTEDGRDIIDTLPASPDIPLLLEQVYQWVESTQDLQQIHIEGHPELTAQILILRRLPPETTWKALSIEYGVSVATLSSFYQRKCLPRLRSFGETEGYL
ncbi:sigma-70 family RNA polymerase sigma factor [Leptolyngbya boryana CZ1]|uniref:Sigma-70 family RNA polymerase sigma factor n=1 Tax=Leptolyngbya boryana CZ1 TaxID=3060204 RepID=A0AA96WRE0_LEPBY|nr:sigma-70 family RNA polymerase sigma factor [Leptolyngbya boryana]WNZ44113.1 sigma-70 family RNA polymerase sigma factor [Leptolyngbya boryana CZ1]